MKLKKMSLAEFEDVRKRDWVAVELVGDALPKWARAIAESSIFATALASGTCNIAQSQPYQSAHIPSGQLIGGIDVYRRSPDDPVPFNKDWYAVVSVSDDSTMLLVDGPQKDAEHWLSDLATRCKGLEILGVPKKPSEPSNET
jgi:hypothetical protein